MDRDLTAVTDEQLAESLTGERNEAACAELFRRYRQRIYLWCHGYTHDLEEAVDLTQEVFVKIFAGVGEFQGNARLSTWIYTITRNHCLGQLAREGEKWRKRLAPLDDTEVPDDGASRILRDADRAGRLAILLEQARDRMKEEELAAFVLHYRDGLAVKEITRTLGCENTTGARTLIQNARRKFRRMTAGKEYADG